MSDHPKSSPPTPTPAQSWKLSILPRLMLKGFVSMYVFINLGATCLSFQTLLSLLVGCLWDN